MELFLQCCAWALVGVICVVVLQKNVPELSLLLAALLSAAIGVVAVSIFQAVFKLMEDITKLTELSPEVIVPVVKAVAIAVCTKITAELCRDAKETAVASSVELVGASAGVYVVLPLVTSVLSLVASLL